MSLLLTLLALTSAFCVVTSQEHGEGQMVIDTMMSGGEVSSSVIIDAVGLGTTSKPDHEIEGVEPTAGKMNKFTSQKVQDMIDGMKNGYRYKYDGTVSTHEDDITISMEQLIAMKAQLEGTGTAGSQKKQFTLDEVRMMIDGMNNGLRYNRQGQVSTVTEEVVFTIVELQHLMTELQTQDQVLHQFSLDDLRRMVQGMETGGLQYNYQGQIAQEGQPTISLPQLREYVQQQEAQVGSASPTDIPIMPDVVPGQDLGLKSIGQFTLDQIRNMIAGTESGVRYNYQGQPAREGQRTLTMGQLQRFLNEILSQATTPTADFTRSDLERMLQGINNGLEYNYQGQLATPGQAILTRERIQELLANLDAKGPMNGVQLPTFTIADVEQMLQGMSRGIQYNYQGLEASPGEPVLTREYLSNLLNQLDPQRGMGGHLQTAQFTMDDINRMLTGMDNGIYYNYQGQVAGPGEPVLTRDQLRQFEADLRAKGMGEPLQTAQFTMDDVNRMLTGMDNGLYYNYQGQVAGPGEPVLTRDQLRQFEADLRAKGMGEPLQTAQFTMDDINRMLTGMDNGLYYNYQGQEAGPGEPRLTGDQLRQFEADLRAKGMGGPLQTAQFTMDDINRMLTGMDNGLYYNYQGQVAGPGEPVLTRDQLRQFEADLRAKGMGEPLQTAQFTMDDINRMLTGMDNGLYYNYQGQEAGPGEPRLTGDQLRQFEADLRAKGMGGPLQTAQFTMDDINRMLTGMDNGLYYNYQGQVAGPGEPVLTRDQLRQFEADLRAKGMGEPLQTAQFTMDDINRMLTGMDNGLYYNYQGQEAGPGEPRLTGDQLRQFEADLRAKGMGGPLQTAQFTMDDINRMLTGMDNGLYYNYQGQVAGPGEPVLTRDQLRQFEADLRAKGMGEPLQTAQFTMDDVNRMLTGMDNGLYYNYQGQEAVPGEPRLTREQLRQFEADLRAKGMGEPLQTAQFTMDDINRMLTGMDNGLYYNYQGQEAGPGEPRLTGDQLRQFEADLRAKGMGRPLQTAQFTMDDINRMLTGMDNGLYYNYQGQVAGPGEPVLTRDQLRQFEADLRAKGMGEPLQTAQFTMDDVNRMLTGMDNGLYYNYQGQEAVPGEPRLTREQLRQFEADLRAKGMGEPLQTAQFTMDDINRMLTGMDNGLYYNYQGQVAGPGEPVLTRDQLRQFEADLRAKGMDGPLQTAQFTMDDINRMITGMDNGLYYNYQGQEAGPGEPRLTGDQLRQFEADLMGKVTSTLTKESSAFSESINETSSRQINGAGQTFESTFSSEQSQSSSVSESVVSFGTSDGEASNVVDINLVAKGDQGIFENKATNKNAGFTGVIHEATHIEKEKGLQSATILDAAKSTQGKRKTLKTSGKTEEGKQSLDVFTKIKGVSSVQIGDLADKIGVVNIILNGKPGNGKINETKAKATQTKEKSAVAKTRQNVIFTGKSRTDVEISRSVTTTFTIEEINRMKEGINQGLLYNTQGLPAQQGEELMTLDMLNNYAADLNFKDPQNDFARFTRDDINRMVEGIERGESFNYRGLPPSPGEKILTVEDLSRLRADLDSIGTNGTFNQTKFSVSDLERMIAGMRNGEQFNYDGLPAAVGDPVLSVDELYNILNKLQSASGMGASIDSLASIFTRDEVNQMIDGIRRGESYNYQGLSPSPGEKTLTLEDLNRLISYYDSKAPMLRFSREDINRMIEGIRNGYSYNYQGLPPAPGEKTVTLDELTRLLDRENVNLTLVGADTAKFTLDDLERMLAGMDNGLSYNYQGQEASPGESTLSRAQLETFYATLKGGQNTIIMANITTDSNTTTYSLDNTRFTLEDLRRFLEGMDQGQEYNYQGKIASTGEPTISRQQLERRIRFLENMRTLSRTFTLEEIQRMLDGIDGGKTYNYQGQEAVPGESTLTRDELTVHLLDLLASRFNQDDINRMLAGIDRGEVYNYQGQPALTGERILTREQLSRILSNINTSRTHTRTFTIEEIQRMLDGIDGGKTYNFRGQKAVPGESTLARDELTVHLLELLASRFNRDDINRMLAGIDRGEVYNYQGQPALTGERTLTREELNRILSNIDSAGTRYRTFSLEEIQRMLDGIDGGKTYNHQGQEAVPGEPTMTRDELTVHLLELLALRFNRDDINRMLAGIDRGEVYNYQGQPALTGERTLTREELNRILSNINAAITTTFKRRDFTIDQIQRMLDGMKNGLTYNYQGEEAAPGERILNRNDLTIFLLDLLASRFNRDDVNNILAGIDRGEAYNFEGKPARTGEPILEREILTRLLPVLEKSTSSRNFTMDEILTMLDGIERGLQYNYEGMASMSGEPTLSRDELYLLFFKLLATNYNVDYVYSMLADMDKGLRYAYNGQLANEGERSWDRRLLEEFLIHLLRQRYGNVALQKPAEISSTFDPVWTADKGVDGNRNGNISKDSCFHTLEEKDPYFIVDLEREHNLNSLVMYNRIDCCSERAVNLLISTGNSKDNMTVQNVVVGPIGERYALSFTPNTNARFVKIQSKHNESFPLHMCEVELYGTPTDKASQNVALYKSAEISSEINPTWTADKGVDGATSQNMFDDTCFHTNNETEPYFIVNLGSVYDISNIYIYNRQDCCEDRASNIEISTGLTRDDFVLQDLLIGPLSSVTNIPLPRPTEAQYVKIQSKDLDPTYLHLCEVEVYGDFVRDDSCLGIYPPCQNGGYCTNLGGEYNCICTGNWTGPNCSEPVRECFHDGVTYYDGEMFKDDCNTCLCMNGFAACTRMACPGRPCLHNEVFYRHGDRFKDDCNECICNNGRVSCTLESCPRPCYYNGTRYAHGDTYKYECNTCRCMDGYSACTRMACVNRPCFHKGRFYSHGSSFKDDCNTCTCYNGTSACTLMACRRSCLYNGLEYPDGSRFKDDCNTCQCNDGNAVCTKMACGKTCIVNGIEYADGEFFKDDCNNCTCNDGIAACTKMACGGYCMYKGEGYFEGERFKDDCNDCTCSGGKVSCTYMMCPGRKPGFCPKYTGAGICIDYCREDSDCPGIRKCCSNGCGHLCMMPEFEGDSCYHYGVRYANGESFKDDCNTCRCTNGIAECTRMGCPPRENIAFQKDTKMSSHFNDRWTPDKAVDGDTTSDMYKDSCFHTLEEPNPYWQVDLGAVYDVDQIEIYNRGDCCGDRLNNLEISTGLAHDALIDQRFIDGPLPERTKIPLSPPVRARFIELQNRNVTPSFFHICEVVVYGDYVGGGALSCFHKGVNYSHGETFKDDCNNCTCMNGTAACTQMDCSRSCYHYGIEYADGESFKDDCNTCRCSNGMAACTRMACPPRENIAFQKDAVMSSHFNNKWTPDKAVDGNRESNMYRDSCFHTLEEPNPYWRVNLGAVYDVDQIEIYNRGDCCGDRLKNLAIATGLTRNDLVQQQFIEGPLPERTKLSLSPGVRTQFIEFQIRNDTPNFFHICEVIVHGDFVRDGALSCFHKGVNYSHGETFKDDCNNCTCMNGTAACTQMDCSRSCYHYGIEYADGESFKDDCNTCRCSNGMAACTRMACPPRENIAFQKDAEMSSHFNNKWTPDKAVDGNRESNMYRDSCFHTLEEPNPYWRVNLGAVYDVDQIEIYNRDDCCGDRLKNLAIATGLTRNDLVQQQFIEGPLPERTKLPLSPGVRTQFIELQIRNDTPNFFHICEVIVHGDFVRDDLCSMSPCLNGGTCTNKLGTDLCICTQDWTGSHCHISTQNIAYNKPTELSSLYKNDPRYSGDKAVDGDTNGDMSHGSCFHTEMEREPYWMVDLGAVYELQNIVLHNRQDSGMEQARDIEILAGLTKEDLERVYYHAGELGPMRSIPIVSGTEAQYILVHNKNLRPRFLHLCEVEVFGVFVRKDLCENNPCRNGGTCTNRPGGAICNCPQGYGGIHCRDSLIRPTPPPGVTDMPEPDWNGSRIDPAVCRRAHCNLPICYVPYPNDCAKYVVCQRTAIGTYVAWKMRCAFGSYWGTGRTYTCERVEDLAKQGYVCPNDRCANTSLITYPDEDVSNCRTYWRCDNGISRPNCCPPGQAFNRDSLQCESDPHEYCRSPCPLKIDGCVEPGSHTEPFYDGNCRTYWNCRRGHSHPVCCKPGMSYDFVLSRCAEDSSCTDPCPPEYDTNLCTGINGLNQTGSYTLADGNCRTYMKCRADGYDDPFCCRQDYFYNATSARCELLEDENDVCRSEVCPRGYKEDCRFTAIPDNPKQFYDGYARIVRQCAPGTTFAPDICTCDGSSLINVCKAEVWAKFDQLEDKWSVKNYGDGWISVFGDMSKNRTAQGITYATFDGSSGMEVWRYDHTALPAVTLEITFEPVVGGVDRQILVSNCMSVDNGDASFEVSLDPRNAQIIFKGKSKFDSAELSVPYNRQGWNTFKLFFDGEHLVAVVEDPSGDGKTEIRGANLRGDITAGVGAMKFGPCLDSFSMPKNNGFTGFVSEVIFSKCIDNRGREFINQHLVPEVRRTQAEN